VFREGFGAHCGGAVKTTFISQCGSTTRVFLSWFFSLARQHFAADGTELATVKEEKEETCQQDHRHLEAKAHRAPAEAKSIKL
jgi:hypothetical protein